MDSLEKSIAELEKTRGKMKVKQPGLLKPAIVIVVALLSVAALVALAVIVVEKTGMAPAVELPPLQLPDVGNLLAGGQEPGEASTQPSGGMPQPTGAASPGGTAAAVDSFPLTGSYVCTVGGMDYMVYEETYFYIGGEDLVVVSEGKKMTVTPGGKETTVDATANFFVSAPGAVCVEDPLSGEIMEAASETGIVAFSGTEYFIEAWK